MVVKRMLRGFVITTLVAFALGSLIALLTGKKPVEPEAGALEAGTGEAAEAPDSDSSTPASADPLVTELVEKLIEDGWTEEAAAAVVELNREWFAIQREEHPTRYLRQESRLRGLGAHKDLMPFIARRPETAGLLASLEDPGVAVGVLHDAGADYHRIAGFFAQHVDPKDAQALARGLKDNWELVGTLHERGLLNPEVLFVFDRESEAARTYERWLRETLERRMLRTDEELASYVNLVMRHGPAIRARMKDNPRFRTRFRSELWPALLWAGGSEEGMLEVFLEEPRIWDLLATPNGETLLKSSGLIAIDLLYGHPEIGHIAYPSRLQPRVRELLLRQDADIVDALFQFRQEPLFHRLLERPLSVETFRNVLSKLARQGPNYPQLLAYYDGLSNSALAEEVGPAPSGLADWTDLYYTVYEVPKKLLQGRHVSGRDYRRALFGLTEFVQIGRAVKGIRMGIRLGGTVGTSLRASGNDLASKRLSRQTIQEMGERELSPWAVTSILAKSSRAVRNARKRPMTFDVTGPVRFAFQYSGVGRESFKRLTGLEARLFMRSDARVYVHLSDLAKEFLKGKTLDFFEDRLIEAVSDGSAEEKPAAEDSIAEEPVEEEGVMNNIHDTEGPTQEQIEDWKKLISAWWLLNASLHSSDLRVPEFMEW